MVWQQADVTTEVGEDQTRPDRAVDLPRRPGLHADVVDSRRGDRAAMAVLCAQFNCELQETETYRAHILLLFAHPAGAVSRADFE
jgi:hypothetical protein